MNGNYIVINGKKIELTEEQLKQLGIEPEKKRKNPFDRVAEDEVYFKIGTDGDIFSLYEFGTTSDEESVIYVNYFNDEAFAQQVSLHQLLYRKLLRFAYDNGYEDTALWNGTDSHWNIRYSKDLNKFVSYRQDDCKAQGVYFSSEKGAEQAIAEVLEPFMKEHPEFVW